MGRIEGIRIGNAASSSTVMMLAMDAGIVVIAAGISVGTTTTGSNGIGTGTITTVTTGSASSTLIAT